MRRPVSFAPLAFLFAWLTLAGVSNMWVALRYPKGYGQVGLNTSVMALWGFLYAISAAAVAIGLWRVAAWLPRAVLAWGLVLLGFMISFQAMIGVRGEPVWLFLAPYPLFGALVWAIYRHTRRQVQQRAPAV